MRLYWEIARRGFRRYAVYRSATMAGAFTNTVFGVLRCYILLAAFTHRTHIGNLSPQDAVTFSLVAESALMLTSVFVCGTEVAPTIRTGAIWTRRYRPGGVPPSWVGRRAGAAAYAAR